MLRSMYSGVSGLRSHQTMMDVIGNNIANVNTVGYKSSSVVFQDLLSQALRGAGSPTTGTSGNGGTNPAQVGLGVRVGGIATSFTQGAAQNTGRSTDMSIQGDGLFVVRQAGQELYTRAGALSFDGLGRLTTSDGAVLQGWSANAAGAINTNATVSDLTMPLGQAIAPAITANITMGGNLPADAPVNALTLPAATPGSQVVSSITIYDIQGAAHDVSVTFTHTSANNWSCDATMKNVTTGVPASVLAAPVTFTWNPAATPPAFTAPATPLSLSVVPAGTTFGDFGGKTVKVGFGTAGTPDALSQYAGTNSLQALSQDGSALGSLQSFTIGQDGVVTGVFSNGKTRAVGQVAVASFANPVGLEKTGSSLYRAGVNSGLASIGAAGVGGRGTLAGGTLEMSNVDLAQEFTNLIVAQRGFQANSKVITASDELLQDLVNLKR
ncbi:MAG: Flagellar hook protein FlgE [Actinomycetia bacterium]|nr:Flagellar hook protein FlgE [Actinomycetes bacterium]